MSGISRTRVKKYCQIAKDLDHLLYIVFYSVNPDQTVPKIDLNYARTFYTQSLFVCVEVLRPSQPNGVMSSAVSLPNHMFTGQA